MSGNDAGSNNKSKQPLIGGKSKQVWFGRPSVSVFYLLYGIVALVIVGILVGLELWGGLGSLLAGLFFQSMLVSEGRQSTTRLNL